MPNDLNPSETPEWHKKLVASLQECEQYDRSENPVKGCLGMLFFVFAIPGAFFWLAMSLSDGGRAAPPSIFVLPLIFAGLMVARVFIFYPLSRYLVRRSKASMRESALEEVLNQFRRKPILYLRSFAMDADMNRIHWFHKYFGNGAFFALSKEEQLVGQLFSYGPVIGIGKPDEDFPELGAARFYASNDIWQEKILDGVEAAQLVVWMTGTSDGLEWEIQTLTKTLDHSKLLVVCHPQLLRASESEKELEWRKFVEKMDRYFPSPFPKTLGDTRFFIFDENWNPIPVSARKQQSAMVEALRQLHDTGQLTSPKKPIGCGVLIIYLAFPFLGTIFGATLGGTVTGELGGGVLGGIGGFVTGLILGGIYLWSQIKKWKEA